MSAISLTDAVQLNSVNSDPLDASTNALRLESFSKLEPNRNDSGLSKKLPVSNNAVRMAQDVLNTLQGILNSHAASAVPDQTAANAEDAPTSPILLSGTDDASDVSPVFGDLPPPMIVRPPTTSLINRRTAEQVLRQMPVDDLLRYAVSATSALIEITAHHSTNDILVTESNSSNTIKGTPKGVTLTSPKNYRRSSTAETVAQEQSDDSSPVAPLMSNSPATQLSSAYQSFSKMFRSNSDMQRFASFHLQHGGPERSREASIVVTDQLKKEELDGFKMVNQYMVLRELGRGQYGKVKLAADTNRDDKLVAIKVIPRSKVQVRCFAEPTPPQPGLEAGSTSNSSGDKLLPTNNATLSSSMMREVAIMKKLKHPNIVRLLEVIDDPEAAKLYLVMQCVSRGPLLNIDSRGRCEPIEMGAARRYIRQLCAALHYLQQKKIAHRDIKPENILLGDNGRVYLSDFGVSDWFTGKDRSVVGAQGTLAFMAPEVVRGDSKHDGHAADIWSLGVTFYTMVYGCLPFFAESKQELREAILNDEATIPELASEVSMVLSVANDDDLLTSPGSPMADGDSFLDSVFGSSVLHGSGKCYGGANRNGPSEKEMQLADLILQMLVKDPAKRATMEDIGRHDFFSKKTVEHERSVPAQLELNEPITPPARIPSRLGMDSPNEVSMTAHQDPVTPRSADEPEPLSAHLGADPVWLSQELSDTSVGHTTTATATTSDLRSSMVEAEANEATLKRLSVVKPHLSPSKTKGRRGGE